MAADCRHHVVGPPPGAAPLYDPLPPYDPQKLPGGQLRIVQISDIHPRSCAAMDHTRIPELREKIEACRPDLLVLTGDIF